MAYTTEQKNQLQVQKLFNTSEHVLKEWIAMFLKKKPQDLFDFVPEHVEPVMFYPSSLSHGKYVELKLGIVEPAYSLNIDELLQEKLVRDTLQFFIYSMRAVYGSIMKTTPRCDAHDVNLEWDASTLTFGAEFLPDLKKKYVFYNHVLSCMMQAKDNLPEDKICQWQTDLSQLMVDINENNNRMVSEKVDEAIEAKRLEWADLPKVGVLVRYIAEEDIPAEFKLENLQSVSEQKYEESPDEAKDSVDESGKPLDQFSESVTEMSRKLLQDLSDIEASEKNELDAAEAGPENLH